MPWIGWHWQALRLASGLPPNPLPVVSQRPRITGVSPVQNPLEITPPLSPPAPPPNPHPSAIQIPLRTRHIITPRIQTTRLPQRPRRPLEDRLRNVVIIRPIRNGNVQVHLRAIRQRLEKL